MIKKDSVLFLCEAVVCVCLFTEDQSKEDKSSDVKDETAGKSSPIPVESDKSVKLLTVTVSGEETDGEKSLEDAGTGDSSPGLLQINNFSKEMEAEMQRHRSSASTLNDPTPPSCLGHSQEVELQKLEQEGQEVAALASSQDASRMPAEQEEEKHDQVGVSC